MVSTRRKSAEGHAAAAIPPPTTENRNTSRGYEQFREQRIKENKERMQKLGIFDLSLKLKSHRAPPQKPPKNVSSTTHNKPHHPSPQRRSSRLKSMAPVNYSEARHERSSLKKVKIRLREGSQREIYTEEHEKLLGDCEADWTLCVDGYGKDGKRIYDQEKGETCHQCRQKTLGLHTHCCKCDLVQGQFCGDCLYMRYGENVIEVNKNPNWICPVCRGICNCSLCRIARGWAPTGNLYRKVRSLGFKSVAHYLIKTQRSQNQVKDSAAESLISEERVVPSTGPNHFIHDESLIVNEHPNGFSVPQPDKYEDEMKEEEKQMHCSDNSKHIDNINARCDDENDANNILMGL